MTVGPLIDGLRVVREGLAPEDRVVITGLQRLRPGIVVDPQAVPADSTVATAAPTAPTTPPAD